MVVVKEKIKSLVDIMPVNEAESLLFYIINNINVDSNDDLWDSIVEVEPDEIDMQMIQEMENDVDCNDFS